MGWISRSPRIKTNFNANLTYSSCLSKFCKINFRVV